MAEKFEQGKKYVFRRSLYLQDDDVIDCMKHFNWPKDTDGEEVARIVNEDEAWTENGFVMSPDWCEEVTDE